MSHRLAVPSVLVLLFLAGCDPATPPPPPRPDAPALYTESSLPDAMLGREALRIMGSSAAGGTASCATCHGITRRTIQTWVEQAQVVLDTCLTDLEVTTDEVASDMMVCLHAPRIDGMSGDYRASQASIFSIAAHLDWFQFVFERGSIEGGTGDSWEAEHARFLMRAGMPNEGMTALTQEQVDIVLTWILRGAPGATSILPDDPPPEECVPFVSPEVGAHVSRMRAEGWAARNLADGILMYGCTGASAPEDCLAGEPAARDTAYGRDWDVIDGSTIRELYTTDYASSFWTRSSADGRFVSHGPGVTIDLVRGVEIAVDSPYDPGFFPDNSAFVWPSRVCEQSLLETATSVTFMEPQCDNASIGLYEHVGVSLTGGDYWVVTGEFASDNGGHSATLRDTPAMFSRDATHNFLRMVNGGSGFMPGSTSSFPTPFEGDGVLSPSSTHLLSRIAGPGDEPIGYTMYAIESATGGSCGGTPTACSARSMGDCDDGCSLGSCGGTAVACSALTTSMACTAQSGCAWSGVSCSGAARACSVLDSTRCGMQMGCTLTAGSCGGTPNACDGYASETSCGAADGCAWTTGAGGGAVQLREVARYCGPGTKTAFSYDERWIVTHHYVTRDDAEELGFTGPTDPGFMPYLTEGAANVYLIDPLSGERIRVTNMGPGQYALFPHFRSDGWLYFLVRGDTGVSGERVMASDVYFHLPN